MDFFSCGVFLLRFLVGFGVGGGAKCFAVAAAFAVPPVGVELSVFLLHVDTVGHRAVIWPGFTACCESTCNPRKCKIDTRFPPRAGRNLESIRVPRKR